ncbi:MAG: hypothetical protein WCO77_08460 [bacterium]
MRLLTIHNLHRTVALMREVREALDQGVFSEFKEEFLIKNKEDR